MLVDDVIIRVNQISLPLLFLSIEFLGSAAYSCCFGSPQLPKPKFLPSNHTDHNLSVDVLTFNPIHSKFNCIVVNELRKRAE